MLESSPCDQWRCGVQLAITIGIATLLLGVTLFSLGTNQIPSAQAAPVRQGAGPVITIGVASALTGPVPDLGWQQVNAVQLAVSQTNAAGGITIGGTNYTVTLVIADSGCDATQAITAANQLLAAGVVGVVGHLCSSASIPAASVYNSAGVAMVSPASTSPYLTQQGYTATFRTVPHDGSSAINLASYFASLNLKRTAILIRGDWWSISDYFGALYQNIYSSLGGTIVSSRTLYTTADITPALTAIQTENVDIIFVADPVGDMAGNVSRIAYNLGMAQNIAWLGVEGFGGDYINDFAGPPAAEADYGAIVGRRTTDMPGYAPYQNAYLAANFLNQPDDAGLWSPFAYDAANIIMDAIRRANSTNPLAIRNAIAATTNFAGVVGIYQGFDAAGDVIPQWGRIEVVENGKWIPAQLNAQFYAGQGGTLDLADTWGQTTTVQISGNAVTSTLLVTYSIFATATNAGVPTQTMVGQHAIRLETNVSISSPMTMTIQYNDADIAGIDEATLTLYTWNGNQWVDAQPCGGYFRNLTNNVLQAIICHFSDYVLLGESEWPIYLPIILKRA